MVNAVAVSQQVQCGNEGGAIVGDDFLHGSPSAQQVFEDEGGEGASGLYMEGAPLRPRSEGTASLDDIAKTGGGRH